MNIYEAIEARCSVRKYLDKPIEADKLERVLNAGRLAPSGHNRQEWKFVVVRDPMLRAGLTEATGQEFVGTAPAVIAVVGTNPDKIMRCGMPGDPIDCAIAIDHMTLAAVAEGLGTCWIGSFDQDACCNVLDVPATAKIVQMLVIGYPNGDQGQRPRKDLDQIVCYDKFS